ncbi:MAG: PAS domain S-box protein, partial [Desulfobacterales bacterium]|nr:PAS domain S-box protein [Desulfobacterales bacterium]
RSYISGWHRGEKGKVEKLVAYTPVRAGSHVWSVAVCAPVSEVERLTSKAHRNHLYTMGFTVLVLTGAGTFFFIAFYRWSLPLRQEIATRKQAEERLRETRNYLENLIDYANAPIIVWDPEFKITRFNHAFERLTQKNAGVVLGAGLDILFPDDRREEAMAHIRRTATGERWEAVEIPILRADGTARIVLWNSATLYAEDDATVVATIAQGQDITGRKRAEEQLQKAHDNLEVRVKERTAELAETNESLNQEITERKRVEEALRLAHGNLKIKAAALKEANKELSEYGYVVSHDIRAPLRAIHNYAEYLSEDLEATLEGEQKEYLDGLCRAVRQSEELAEDLLELSRVGRERGPTETIDVGVFLKKVIASLDLPPDVEVVTANDWPAMEIEPTLFRQIFQNLISNAIKFNRSERKRIEVGWRPADEGRHELFVRDNGIGIEPRYQEQIFGVFQRLHTRQEYEGSGIGLAVIKKATSKLQGSVRVESKPGEGSTFFIVLPKTQKEG